MKTIKAKEDIILLTGFKETKKGAIGALRVLILLFLLSGCDDFVDVDLPKDQLTSETVFNDVTTATAALMNIYFDLNGRLATNYSIGVYTDELELVTTDDDSQSVFYNHTVSILSAPVWWSKAYNLIYQANAIVEGVENSTDLPLEDKKQLKGEALFIRSYLHFLLVELYGPIPYINTTDYITNTTVSRMSVDLVNNHIISDLIEASSLLNDDISVERIRAYQGVVDALLARVYLYVEDWEAAEDKASAVIDSFVLEPNLEKVFVKNASGSIWQFKSRQEGANTSDGFNFIFFNHPGVDFPVLSLHIMDAFERGASIFQPGDLRRLSWTKEVSSTLGTWHHAYKYKETGQTLDSQGEPESKEYTVIFRLAEQYLIRAEARAQRGDISGAQSDVNVIRTRAGLENTTAATTEELLDAILHERKVELFTEGHRWFDLKRTGKAAEVLAPIKPNWRDTDLLFPISESELLLNPNLLPQNDGY